MKLSVSFLNNSVNLAWLTTFPVLNLQFLLNKIQGWPILITWSCIYKILKIKVICILITGNLIGQWFIRGTPNNFQIMTLRKRLLSIFQLSKNMDCFWELYGEYWNKNWTIDLKRKDAFISIKVICSCKDIDPYKECKCLNKLY